MTDAREAVSPAPVTAAGLWELTRLFLRLGFTAFGGPAAHIALMKSEVVTRRKWLTEAEYLDLLGATNLIPGPNSTEMAIHIGFLRGRWLGLLLAGICFILPAALIVSVFAWGYVRFGTLPQVVGVLYTVKPVVVAVVVQAIWGLVRPALKSRFLAVIGVAVVALVQLGVDELLLLFGAGALAGTERWLAIARSSHASGKNSPPAVPVSIRPLLVMLLIAGLMVALPSLLTKVIPDAPATSVTATRTSFGMHPLFLFFLKVGTVLYGSGYVLLAFLRDGLVNRWHWLTSSQLLDAVAVGQVTPGPVFTTATFIGYVLGGPVGALVATLGIFLPSFVFVALSGPLVPRIRQSLLTGAFLDGVNVAALALMVFVTWQLGRTSLVDWLTVSLAAFSAFLLIRFKVNSAWLILGAAMIGIVASLFGFIPQ